MALLLGDGSYLLLGDNGKILLTGDQGAVYHTLSPAWRTLAYGNGTTSLSWTSPLDPSEMKNYTINCSQELDGISSRIANVDLDLDLLSVAAGLQIYGMTNDATNVTVWFNIDAAERTKPNWNPPGEVQVMRCTVTALDGHIFERTIALSVMQVGQNG